MSFEYISRSIQQYLYSVSKKHVDADYSVSTKKTESSHKAPKFKESKLVSTKIFLAQVRPKIG